jgi:hypothetical protein
MMNYQANLERGLCFQDFAADVLADLGIHVSYYVSKQWQQAHGESRNRIEIKYDSRCTETEQLSIETAETTALGWIPSGIYRPDNTIWIIQGNQQWLALFEKRWLQAQHSHFLAKGIADVEWPNGNPTVRRFFLPLSMAEKIATQIWTKGQGWHR